MTSAAPVLSLITRTPPPQSSSTLVASGLATPPPSAGPKRDMVVSVHHGARDAEAIHHAQASSIDMQVEAHQSSADLTNAPSSRNASSWSGMDSMEYMQSSGYSSNHFSAADHANFISYPPTGEHHSQGQLSHQQSASSQGMAAANSQSQISTQQNLFPAANSAFQHDVMPSNGQQTSTLDAKDRLGGGSNFHLPMPTPPDSSRRPASRQMAEGEMEIDEAGMVKDSHGGTLQRQQSAPEAPNARARRGQMTLQTSLEMESPSPLGLVHSRMVHQGSPTPNQRPLLRSDMVTRSGSIRSVPSHRSSQSLEQAGHILSGSGNASNERPGTEGVHISAPVSPIDSVPHANFPPLVQVPSHRHPNHAMLGHAAVMQHHQEQFRHHGGPHIRQGSPSDNMSSASMASMASQQQGPCSVSPLGSARFNPDSSFGSQDTSTDSISNTASASVSRASSTSDELLSHDFSNGFVPPSMRMSKRKRKLLNLDRKLICDFQLANPDAKQDAIAAKFGIERSTVSKILKQKDKWLKIDPSSESAKIAKHRTAKFPEVEDRLTEWVTATKREGKVIHDVMIRQEALRIAKEIGLTVEKFKASGGWIEKFRERNQLPKSVPTDESETVEGSPKAPSTLTLDADEVQAQQMGMTLSAKNINPGTEASSGAHSAESLPSVMAPSASLQSLKNESMEGADQKTPTSNQKRQFDTMAVPQQPGSNHHVSPLNTNLARMQFASQPVESFGHHGLQSPFGQGTNPDMASHHHHHHHPQHHQPHPEAIFGGHREFSSPVGEMNTGPGHHGGFYTGVPSMPERDAGSSTKRRRAGTDGSRLDAGLYGPAFSDRQVDRQSMDAFHFPATPINHSRLRQMSLNARIDGGTMHQQPGDYSAPNGEVAIAPAATPPVRQSARKPRASRAQVTRKSAGRQTSGSHVPEASSPLKGSPRRASAMLEGDVEKASQVELPEAITEDDSRPTAVAEPSLAAATEETDASIVTAEQAQQSLELVLRFLSEQPSNFLPSSHFVVFGHLQANIEQLIRDRRMPPPSSAAPSRQTSPTAAER